MEKVDEEHQVKVSRYKKQETRDKKECKAQDTRRKKEYKETTYKVNEWNCQDLILVP